MPDNFEEWDFRTKERVRNIPDWEDDNYVNGGFTVMDFFYTILCIVCLIAFWGGIIWLVK